MPKTGSTVYGRLVAVEEKELVIDQFDREFSQFIGITRVPHAMEFTTEDLVSALGNFVNVIVIDDKAEFMTPETD